MHCDDYAAWMESWLRPLIRLLKPTASVYICGDWRSCAPIFEVASSYLIIQNRITWEREKGRGALETGKMPVKISGFVLSPKIIPLMWRM